MHKVVRDSRRPSQGSGRPGYLRSPRDAAGEENGREGKGVVLSLRAFSFCLLAPKRLNGCPCQGSSEGRRDDSSRPAAQNRISRPAPGDRFVGKTFRRPFESVRPAPCPQRAVRVTLLRRVGPSAGLHEGEERCLAQRTATPAPPAAGKARGALVAALDWFRFRPRGGADCLLCDVTGDERPLSSASPPLPPSVVAGALFLGAFRQGTLVSCSVSTA